MATLAQEQLKCPSPKLPSSVNPTAYVQMCLRGSLSVIDTPSTYTPFTVAEYDTGV